MSKLLAVLLCTWGCGGSEDGVDGAPSAADVERGAYSLGLCFCIDEAFLVEQGCTDESGTWLADCNAAWNGQTAVSVADRLLAGESYGALTADCAGAIGQAIEEGDDPTCDGCRPSAELALCQ